MRDTLYGVALWSAFAAGAVRLRATMVDTPRARIFGMSSVPRATCWLLLAVAIPTALQFRFPAILTALQRDAFRVMAGEWWRLITSLFVQDSGAAGSLFNLVSLLAVGSVAEELWGSRRWLLLFGVSGIVGEAVALAWQPVGAGTSLAIFGLAAAVALRCLSKSSPGPARLAAVVAIGAALWLLVLKDIHGAASLTGIVLASLMMMMSARSA